MKNLFSFIIVCVLFSCSHTEELDDNSNGIGKISLIAPSGDVIAASVTDLMNEIAPVVAEQFDIDKSINIIKVTYAPIESGYIATIYCSTEDGMEKIIIKTNIMDFDITEDIKVKEISSIRRIQTRNENSGRLNGMLVTCSNPSPDCNCIPTFIINNGRTEYNCGKYCDDCEMTLGS